MFLQKLVHLLWVPSLQFVKQVVLVFVLVCYVLLSILDLEYGCKEKCVNTQHREGQWNEMKGSAVVLAGSCAQSHH